MLTAALFAMLVLSQIVSLVVILAILNRTEKFLTKSLVYMKSNNIHDVLDATQLLQPDRNRPEAETSEVVDDAVANDTYVEDLLRKTQQKHRNKHYRSLGADSTVPA